VYLGCAAWECRAAWSRQAVPQLGSRAFSGRAWRGSEQLGSPRARGPSTGRPATVPRLLEPAASEAADSSASVAPHALDHSGMCVRSKSGRLSKAACEASCGVTVEAAA
jgi:hypothetical protein